MRAVGEAPQQAADTQLEVLWAGDGTEAREALVRLGVRVRRVHPDQCLQLVASRAPDMLVFSGSAAAQSDAIVRALRTLQPGATLPVVVISRDVPPATAPQRRGGLLARLSAELAPSVLAAAIHERVDGAASLSRLRELSISAGEIDAWLHGAAETESSGFLLTTVGAIAFGPGGRVAPSAALLREALAQSEDGDASPKKVLELPANRLLVLREPPAPAAAVDLSGAQIIVVHPDLERGEALAAALLGAGAAAQLVGVEPTDIAGVAGFAPALVVIAAAALRHSTTTSLWQDARLASASWLVLDESQPRALSPGQLLGPAATLIAAGRARRERLADRTLVVDRIESFGAAGWLREVGRCEQSLTLLLKSASGRSELSLVGGKIRSAAFSPANGGSPQQGQAALQAALAMPLGRVLVGTHEAVMAHEAGLQAFQEPSPSDLGDEPAPSEIRERRAPDGAAEPNAAPARSSFRPSLPVQFSAKTKEPAAVGRALPRKAASTASTPARAQPSRAPAEPVTRSAQPGPLQRPPTAPAPARPKPQEARQDRTTPAHNPHPEPQVACDADEAPTPTLHPKPRATPEDEKTAPDFSTTTHPTDGDEDATPTLRPKPPLATPKEETTAPGFSTQPRATHEDRTPPPKPPKPHKAAFDIALARGVAGPPSIRPRAPLPPEPAEPSPARVSGSQPSGTPAASSALGASVRPPLPRERQGPTTIEPVLAVDVCGPISDNDGFSAPLGAPISALASNLEPAPLAPKLPEQPQSHASVRPKSYRALVLGSAALAIGAALVAIASTGPLGKDALRPDLSRSAHTGEVARSTQGQESAEPPASAASAQTTARDVAAGRSPHPPDQATTPAAHGKVRPTPIPRGSKAAELLQQAKQARDESRPKEAEALLSEVLNQYPDDSGARYHMALTLVRLHRFEEAHAQLSKALALNDASASAWLLKGDIFLQEGRRREALRAWNRCLAVEAAYPTCQQRLTRWQAQ